MAYIQTIDGASADDDLAAAYDTVQGAQGTVANILRVHSVSPKAMLSHLSLYRELMFGASPLTRAERETIAVAVSVANHCHY